VDRDEVVDTALALVEAGGAEALTMRKLASELGVTTTTIYWHVGRREDLVVALIRRQAERQAEVPVVGTTPRERVLSAARNIRTNALAHRNVTALAAQTGATTLLELPLEIALAAELEGAGVRGDAARDAMRAILTCVAGFLVVAWRPSADAPAELRPDALWATVDDERVPAATVAAMRRPADPDVLFEQTLGAVIDAHLPPTPTARRRGTGTSRTAGGGRRAGRTTGART
jgi:AcrR family transcriptional regulator